MSPADLHPSLDGCLSVLVPCYNPVSLAEAQEENNLASAKSNWYSFLKKQVCGCP